MTDEEILKLAKLVQMNQTLLYILGYATSFASELKLKTAEDKKKYRWLMDAIDNVVYLDKPLPPKP